MSIMGLELHGECSGICGPKTYQSNTCGAANTVRDFVPNAERDHIECIFWSLKGMEEGEGGEVQEMFVSSRLRMSYPMLVQLLTGLELVSVLLPWWMNTITIPTRWGSSLGRGKQLTCD